MTRGKRGSRQRPQVKAGTKSPQAKGGIKSWQAIVAALVAAVASIGVALITTFGTQPSSDETGSQTAAVAAHNSPKQLSEAMPRSTVAPAIAIVTFSVARLRPPPPRDLYSFQGTVAGIPASEFEYSKIFVIAQDPDGAGWIVSPPAQVSANGTWTVNNWTLDNPPVSAQWEAVVVVSDVPVTGVLKPSPLPSWWMLLTNGLRDILSTLALSGPSAQGVQLVSKPVHI